MNLFAKLTGFMLSLVKPQKLERLHQAWAENKPSSSEREWYDYLGCYMIYGVLPDEYINFRFGQLNDAGRRAFITEFSRFSVYNACNRPEDCHYFDNKYETYKLLKEYYGRDAILINSATKADDINQFVLDHRRFICKPLKLYCGIGVEIIDAAKYDSPASLLLYIQNKGECIAEELIQQSYDVAQFHKESVNTVRIPAFRTDEGVRILTPQFKAGTGESVVDNAYAGGLLAAVDKNAGIVTTVAVDVRGNEYLRHPDTGVVFPGFQLPDWEQALSLVEKSMRAKPQIRFVGWDLAHTDKGWVVVEGNHEGQFCSQMASHTGYAGEVDQILSKIP